MGCIVGLGKPIVGPLWGQAPTFGPVSGSAFLGDQPGAASHSQGYENGTRVDRSAVWPQESKF